MNNITVQIWVWQRLRLENLERGVIEEFYLIYFAISVMEIVIFLLSLLASRYISKSFFLLFSKGVCLARDSGIFFFSR